MAGLPTGYPDFQNFAQQSTNALFDGTGTVTSGSITPFAGNVSSYGSLYVFLQNIGANGAFFRSQFSNTQFSNYLWPSPDLLVRPNETLLALIPVLGNWLNFVMTAAAGKSAQTIIRIIPSHLAVAYPRIQSPFPITFNNTFAITAGNNSLIKLNPAVTGRTNFLVTQETAAQALTILGYLRDQDDGLLGIFAEAQNSNLVNAFEVGNPGYPTSCQIFNTGAATANVRVTAWNTVQ